MKWLILIVGFYFSTVNAATISFVAPVDRLKGNTFLVDISGDINAGDAATLTALIGKISERELIITLNSAGGSVAEGELMIDQILLLRKSGVKVTTVVRNGAQCGSMCLPVFMAGEDRRAGEISAFYFHGVLPSRFCMQTDTKATESYLQLLRSLGMSPEFQDQLKNEGVFATADKYWMSGTELFQNGKNFVTHLESRIEKKSGQCLSRWPDRPR